jgi:hypothetical protein
LGSLSNQDIYILNSISIIGSSFKENNGISGGGCSVLTQGGYSSPAPMSVEGCLFEGNVASSAGGGLFISYSPFGDGGPSNFPLSISASQFKHNSASGAGGGVYIRRAWSGRFGFGRDGPVNFNGESLYRTCGFCFSYLCNFCVARLLF